MSKEIKLCTECLKKGKQVKQKARGYCKLHYERWRNHGNPNHQPKDFHGMNRTPEHRTWFNMKNRCFNPNSDDYKYYGGRGIKVCDEWKNSFSKFFEYVGKRPEGDYSIDRIDNNGDYEPGNVRWADKRTQRLNQRKSKNNKTGMTGVKTNKSGNFIVEIGFKKVKYYIKTFKEKEKAFKARRKAEEIMWNTEDKSSTEEKLKRIKDYINKNLL